MTAVSTTAAASAAAAARRHASLRWVGVPLLLSGLGLLGAGILFTVQGGPWTHIPLGLLSTGLGLASFGSNHDTAMSLAYEAWEGREGQALGDGLRDELSAELDEDRDGIAHLQASPRVALVMPFVALAVQLGVAWRILG